MLQTVKQLVPFRRWHMAWLRENDGAAGGEYFGSQALYELEKQNSWTAVIEDSPVACGGTIEQWPGRHLAWTYLNLKTGPHMLWLTRAVKEKLAELNGRIELTVRSDFELGHRWAKMLGFEVETPVMRAYGPEKEDHTGYVLLR